MRVAADQDKCIGAGMCVMTAPEVFDQREDDGVVELRTDSPDETQRAAASQAATLCPAGAIATLGN